MITAQTVQLLDANNKNISPAVNIESLYFEGTISSTSPDTYRFALRDKLIVGGTLETLEATADGSTHLYIPYIYASKAFNSNSGVWQIDSRKYDMGDATRDFIDAVCRDKYVTNSSVSSNYLDLNGNNKMFGSIQMNSGVVYGFEGIESASSSPKAYVHLSNTGECVTISGDKSVSISSSYGKVEVAPEYAAMSYGNSTKVSGTSAGVAITTDKDVVMMSGNTSIHANTNITLEADANLDILANNGDVNIKGDYIYLYDTIFPKPDGGSDKQLLSQTTAGEMEWMTLGNLYIENYDGSTAPKKISYIENSSITAGIVEFNGSETKYPVIGESSLKNIKVKSVASGSDVVSLDARETTTVNIKTINGETLIGTGDIVLPTNASVNEAINNKIKTGEAQNIALVSVVDDKFEINMSTVTIINEIVYAKAFAMSSDRELKTDIREDCFEREMPSLHGFKWKDSSVQSYGFIAQELEESGFSEVVYEKEDGTKTVDYMAALSYKVARLENENRKLWEEINKLKKIVNRNSQSSLKYK
jgi:hypothetical protein